MAKTPAGNLKAVSNYVSNHLRSYTFRRNNVYDADIIALLDQQPNVSGYLKALLREEAQKKGFGDLRVVNKKPPINPSVGKFNPEYYPGIEREEADEAGQ